MVPLLPTLLACLPFAAFAGAAALADPAALVERGNELYFQGDAVKALDAYAQAAKLSTTTAQPWLNGGVVLEELGRRQEAVDWYARARARAPGDASIAAALGWAQWRAGRLAQAATTFALALERQPQDPRALLGLARVELDAGRPKEAVKALDKALAAAPLLSVAQFYEGQAYERLGDATRAAEAYKQSVIADSYFAEGREALARLYMKERSYDEAWRQVSKILDAEPKNRKFSALLGKLTPLLRRRPGQLRPGSGAQPLPAPAESAAASHVPTIRVGLMTTPLGKPRPRQAASLRVTCDFDVLDASGKKTAAGEAEETWQLLVKRVKKKTQIALVNASGKTVARGKQFTIAPRAPATGIIALDPAARPEAGAAGKIMRGRLEGALFRGQLRLVNELDLENYTHGVVSAEMPVKSPIEALKAQAVVARTHALFIKKVTRRHRKEGYDVCDEQHCQVYAGARAETARSREVVETTRGRVATYKGSLAHVIYSSNCGGRTQSGKDLVGWGDVPYWQGISDAPTAGPDPRSPWELRQWIGSWPPSYCKPSADVHASHFRWVRMMPFNDLEAKLDRKLRVGKLKTLRALRRSPSGNVNTLLVEGSRKRVRVNSEIQIRGVLGLGSLRSTQFVIDWEYDAKGKPRAVVFEGGGWGHGVGLCQSGAIGRADAGQTYEQIIRAYFKGVELGQLTY